MAKNSKKIEVSDAEKLLQTLKSAHDTLADAIAQHKDSEPDAPIYVGNFKQAVFGLTKFAPFVLAISGTRGKSSLIEQIEALEKRAVELEVNAAREDLSD